MTILLTYLHMCLLETAVLQYTHGRQEANLYSLHSTKPNLFPQHGKLVGTTKHEVILGLDSGVQLHFPKIGYVVREAGNAKL